MRRALVGICVGAVTGLLTLAGTGAWLGYFHGGEAYASPTETPWQFAIYWAPQFVAAYWWFAMGFGGLMGGLGSWLGRPRRSATSNVTIP